MRALIEQHEVQMKLSGMSPNRKSDHTSVEGYRAISSNKINEHTDEHNQFFNKR